jgi:hypothetical protein
MTETDATAAPRPVLADHPGGALVFTIAGAAALGGVFWFPAWFFAAQLLRQWAPRGGMKWLAGRGVPEYADEQYATAIAWLPWLAIVARIAVAINWLEPFQTIIDQRKDAPNSGEMIVLLDVVLGIAIAVALTGVLRTGGWPRLLGLAGFVSVVALAWILAFAPPYPTNGFAVVPLALLGGFTSQLALFFENAPERRARRAAREAVRIEEERRAAAAAKERGY